MEDMVLKIPREETFLLLACISGLNRLVCPLRQASNSTKVNEAKPSARSKKLIDVATEVASRVDSIVVDFYLPSEIRNIVKQMAIDVFGNKCMREKPSLFFPKGKTNVEPAYINTLISRSTPCMLAENAANSNSASKESRAVKRPAESS